MAERGTSTVEDAGTRVDEVKVRAEEAKAEAEEVKGEATGRWQQLQDRHQWLRHVLEAYQLLSRNHGNQYAGAITYFSFVALFPLLLLAVAIAGFVLNSHPDTLNELFNKISTSVPGTLGDTIKESIQQAIDARAGVGIVGLLGVLLTGLGWIGNLREAVDAVWGRQPPKRNFVMSRVSNLAVLGGLGLGIVVSLGLTTVGTSLTDQILRALSLDSIPGFFLVIKVLGIAIAVAGDLVIFWWVLIKLPQADVDRQVAIRGLILVSVGFEILKIVGTYTIAHSASSKTAGPFAVPIAILAWIYLVSRWLMFCCAWLATMNSARRTANLVPIAPSVAAPPVADEPAASTVSPATVGATLVGAGAVAGAVAAWAIARPRE